jgi:hypothetical protein
MYYLVSSVVLDVLGPSGVAHLCRDDYSSSDGRAVKRSAGLGAAARAAQLPRRLAAFTDPGDRRTPVLLLDSNARVRQRAHGAPRGHHKWSGGPAAARRLGVLAARRRSLGWRVRL